MVYGHVTHDSLSNEALNLWWIIGNAMLVWHAAVLRRECAAAWRP